MHYIQAKGDTRRGGGVIPKSDTVLSTIYFAIKDAGMGMWGREALADNGFKTFTHLVFNLRAPKQNDQRKTYFKPGSIEY
jgi:hypothetical protein